MRIGAFARLARVTVKTLRYYADEDLLRPVHVDPTTGYRYYEAGQLRRLNLILNLREAGLGLPEIRAVLDGAAVPAVTGAALEAHKAALMAEKAAIERRIELVDALARAARSDAGDILSEVRLRVVEPQLAHTVRATVPTLGSVEALFESAEAAVAALSARAPVSPFLLFHDPAPRSADIDLEVCIPVTRAQGADVRVVPGDDLCCSVTYAGSYAQTDRIRARLSEWLAGAGLAPCGPVREVYHRFGANLEGYELPAAMLAAHRDDYLTEVQVAVASIHDTDEGD